MNNYYSLIQRIVGKFLPNNSKVALLDFPNYSNVGDSAIWLGVIKLLEEGLKSQIVYVDDANVPIKAVPRFSEDTIILLNGGGNFGDLWTLHQNFREHIVAAYPNNRIIQLPQSIHFQSPNNLDACRLLLKAHKKFHLLVRDQISLEVGRNLHNGPTVLCPDMALCLGRFPRTCAPSQKIYGLLRTDKEQAITWSSANGDPYFTFGDWVNERLPRLSNITAYHERLTRRFSTQLSWLPSLRPLLYRNIAKQRLRRGCGLLSVGEVVITDRLHGHILCTLMDIPHVVLDNSYGKISGFRNAWQTGDGLCQSAATFSEAMIKARIMLSERHEVISTSS